ncbi:hypothetical protein DERP_003503 [Dermatophagoides pteronyssinus]|uniref:Uncharacterized protein n=1 Tax=Dermatophagoides pteronyssinus TaxID=6956 RepID=A0ABQ8JLC6_DERPT|nr:hypothetical protein DERP_003503 [Dermatophagoides pteronyssinus]
MRDRDRLFNKLCVFKNTVNTQTLRTNKSQNLLNLRSLLFFLPIDNNPEPEPIVPLTVCEAPELAAATDANDEKNGESTNETVALFVPDVEIAPLS